MQYGSERMQEVCDDVSSGARLLVQYVLLQAPVASKTVLSGVMLNAPSVPFCKL